MTRSCRAVLDYAFGDGSLNRVEIRVQSGNARSREIPVRLGFQYEGTERQAFRVRDSYADTERYSMLASEWPPGNT